MTTEKPLVLGLSSRKEPEANDNDQGRLPTNDEIDRASKVLVYDANGDSRAFNSLWDRQDKAERRNIVVFIRHFFCGSCQEYVRSLSRDLSPTELSLRNPPSTLTIIGCGDHALIPEYISRTGCKFEIYADPTRSLYTTLGMTCSLALGEKPEYITKGFFNLAFAGAWDILSAPTAKQGNMSQNGGEFIWIDGEMTWARRMRNTRDHIEVDDLKSILDRQEGDGGHTKPDPET